MPALRALSYAGDLVHSSNLASSSLDYQLGLVGFLGFEFFQFVERAFCYLSSPLERHLAPTLRPATITGVAPMKRRLSGLLRVATQQELPASCASIRG